VKSGHRPGGKKKTGTDRISEKDRKDFRAREPGKKSPNARVHQEKRLPDRRNDGSRVLGQN